MGPDFISPAVYFKDEAYASFYRLLSEIDSVDLRRYIYSFIDRISILPATVTSEIYQIFGSNEAQRKTLVDFSIAKTFSYVLHDHVVDRDFDTEGEKGIRYEEVEIIIKLLDEIGSQRLGSCSAEALEHFKTASMPYFEAMWEELRFRESLENCWRLCEKKSKIFNAMFGAAAIAGGATGQELTHILDFAENFYKASQVLDDLRDCEPDAKWNLVTYLGREKAEEVAQKFKQKAIDEIFTFGDNEHVAYLIDIVHYLYQ